MRRISLPMVMAIAIVMLAVADLTEVTQCMASEPVIEPVASATATTTPQPTPAPTEKVELVLVGIASTYGPGFDGLTAVPIREWRGKRVRVCYDGRCIVRTVNDLGPDQRVHPDRVIDLDAPSFEMLAGGTWRIGLLKDVTVTLLDE